MIAGHSCSSRALVISVRSKSHGAIGDTTIAGVGINNTSRRPDIIYNIGPRSVSILSPARPQLRWYHQHMLEPTALEEYSLSNEREGPSQSKREEDREGSPHVFVSHSPFK